MKKIVQTKSVNSLDRETKHFASKGETEKYRCMNDHPFRHNNHARSEKDVLREGMGHRILGVHGRSVLHPAYGSSRLSRVHLPLQARRFSGNILS